jgi:hypothetical protein
MGIGNVGDWAVTRNPARNAQIEREVAKQAAIEAAYLKHLQAFRERRAQNLPGIEKYINQQIPILLDAWQQQVDNAVTDEPYAVAEESKVFWWLALAGNMVWAATSFLDPAIAIENELIVLLAHTGAAVNAGVVKELWGDLDSSHGAKVFMRQKIAKARGDLEALFQGKRREWGSRFERLQDWEQADEILLDQFNVYIWQQMFPTIAYDAGRFDQIRVMAVQTVHGAVADYNRQWMEFKSSAAWFGEAELKKHNIVFRPVLMIKFGDKLLSTAPSSGLRF